jgi:hypothetical protein
MYHTKKGMYDKAASATLLWLVRPQLAIGL